MSFPSNFITRYVVYNIVSAFLALGLGLAPASAQVLEVRVSAGSDDAEESPNGSMYLGSSDLEFVVVGGTEQTIGMRFNAVQVPQGATIVNAYIQFQVDETSSVFTSLAIQGEATDNALTFSSAGFNISSRNRTGALVGWDPLPWTDVGTAGIDQQTPDLSTIIQEIVSRPGWTSGNSLAIIVTGTGERIAESFNGVPAAAPLLRVEYGSGTGTNQAPVVDAGPPSLTVTLPNDAALNGTVTDDGLPIPPGAVATLWSQVSGPATVSFGDAGALTTTASFPVDGTYVLRLSADDGEITDFDELTVTVSTQGSVTTTEVRVSATSDDAEERASGSVSLASSDLEFVVDGGTEQTIGMRFNAVQVPQGATIVNAYIQFQVDETSSVFT
ncbi:MAG: hypothetical protein OEN20_12025, partial [Gammaproteobacteria bacterium]|nr:hypothetical protein [Gammaproteobacteria bacterium]